jgi:hypothetical protein
VSWGSGGDHERDTSRPPAAGGRDASGASGAATSSTLRTAKRYLAATVVACLVLAVSVI